jgi:hypothetical protein
LIDRQVGVRSCHLLGGMASLDGNSGQLAQRPAKKVGREATTRVSKRSRKDNVGSSSSGSHLSEDTGSPSGSHLNEDTGSPSGSHLNEDTGSGSHPENMHSGDLVVSIVNIGPLILFQIHSCCAT